MKELLCLIGEKRRREAQKWLDEKPEGFLVHIHTGVGPSVFETHPRTRVKVLDSPLQEGKFIQEIAWQAVLLPLEFFGDGSAVSNRLQQGIETAHRAAGLLLSDGADWGVSIVKNAYRMRQSKLRDGMQLKGAFKKTPAIVLGAGPSLKRAEGILSNLKERALLFAGGAALNALHVEPHFAASIDKEAPYRQFKKGSFWQTPFCLQPRMSGENFSLIHGEKILFPDSHFPFISGGRTFDSGWTVGTFLIALAAHMGCSPIYFIGMDLCYEKGQKYGAEEAFLPDGLIETEGKLTQGDWLMARDWISDFAKKHPETDFIDLSHGLPFAHPVQKQELSQMRLPLFPDLQKRVHEAVQALPSSRGLDWELWRKSLARSAALVEASMFGGQEGDLPQEVAYEQLLEPLWRLWAPVFSRALEKDSYPEKMKLNRLIFFQQVIQEHIYATE